MVGAGEPLRRYLRLDAAADRRDRSSPRAKELLAAGEALVTSDHVLVESWTLLGHRLGRGVAQRFWSALRGGLAIVEPVGLADLEAAWAIGEVFPDQDFSIVDRTSFLRDHAATRSAACGHLR